MPRWGIRITRLAQSRSRTSGLPWGAYTPKIPNSNGSRPTRVCPACVTSATTTLVLHVPEEQFLALTAQAIHVADVVAVAVNVVEDDPARSRTLDVLPQVSRRKPAHPPVGLHRPIDGTEAFFRGDDAGDGRHEVAPLQILLNEGPVLDAQFRRIDDQAHFLVRLVANAQETVGIGERECAQDAHLQVGPIFFHRQPQ